MVVVVELLSERSASAKMFMNRTRSFPLNDESVAVSGAASTALSVSVASLGTYAVSAVAVSVVVSVVALGGSVIVAAAAAAAVSVVVVAPAVVVVATVADVVDSTMTSVVVGAIVVVVVVVVFVQSDSIRVYVSGIVELSAITGEMVVIVVVADVAMLEGCSPNIGVSALNSALLLPFSSSSASPEAQEAAADSCIISEAFREFLSPTELPSCRSSRPTTGNAHSSAEVSSTSSEATISSRDWFSCGVLSSSP